MQLQVEIKHPKNQLKSNIKITSSGKILFQKTLNALDHSHALSPSNKYFVIQLANSDHSDSGKCFLFDVSNKSMIFSKRVDTCYELPMHFLFKEKDERLFIKFTHGEFEITNDGEILEKYKYYQSCLNADYSVAIQAARGLLKDNQEARQIAPKVIRAMENALQKTYNEFHGITWTAQALKVKAVAHETVNEHNLALQCNIDALYLDPRIGVKKKITSLSKKLNINSENIHVSAYIKKLPEHNKLIQAKSFQESEEAKKNIIIINEPIKKKTILKKPLTLITTILAISLIYLASR